MSTTNPPERTHHGPPDQRDCTRLLNTWVSHTCVSQHALALGHHHTAPFCFHSCKSPLGPARMPTVSNTNARQRRHCANCPLCALTKNLTDSALHAMCGEQSVLAAGMLERRPQRSVLQCSVHCTWMPVASVSTWLYKVPHHRTQSPATSRASRIVPTRRLHGNPLAGDQNPPDIARRDVNITTNNIASSLPAKAS